MRTIRRLYFYLVTLISLEVVIWGLVNLLRTTVDLLPGKGGTSLLSSGLSLVLVGLPIGLLHWHFAQGEALKDEDERATRIRALFFYALRAAILVPVVQSLLAIFSRTLLQLLRFEHNFGHRRRRPDDHRQLDRHRHQPGCFCLRGAPPAR